MLKPGVTVVTGSLWGDEGKGKVIDVLTGDADMLIRAQGGSNAGHTVVVDGQKYKFRLLPSGILRSDVPAFLAPGVMIDAAVLIKEIEDLKASGATVSHLNISDRAHMVMPYHPIEDRLEEEARGDNRLGTTGVGIGPAYADKVRRIGFRIGDLEKPTFFRKKLQFVLKLKRQALAGVEFELPDEETIYDQFMSYADELLPYVTDMFPETQAALESGKRILIEGAHAPLLDLDFGTYPYVTSCGTTASGVCAAAGIPPTAVRETIIVTKAYSTRVGYGPFPTEWPEEEMEPFRNATGEFGTTTGRARRIGWFDAIAVRYAAKVNGATGLALTSLDSLDDMETIRVASAYESKGEAWSHPMANVSHLKHAEVRYEQFSGWKTSLREIRSMDRLPEAALSYIRGIEALSEVQTRLVSLGPDREHTLTL